MVTDWIVAICTIVYVFATIVIMWANSKATELSKKQMLEGRKQFEKQQRLAIRPYLNLYVAREDENIDRNEHYSIIVGENSCKNVRTFSIRNIGNGSAKDIEICIERQGNSILQKNISGRNRFMLVNKQYVYDIYFNDFENISLSCNYTDLYDNIYQQKMEIYLDTENGEIMSHTYNPIFLEK